MPYIGRDGLTHQETVIDWDKTLNTKVSSFHRTAKQREIDNNTIKDIRLKRVENILSINPALAGEQYESYVIRDYDKGELRWDEPLIRGRIVLSPSQDDSFLRDMEMILEKRQEAFNNNTLSLKTPQVK